MSKNDLESDINELKTLLSNGQIHSPRIKDSLNQLLRENTSKLAMIENIMKSSQHVQVTNPEDEMEISQTTISEQKPIIFEEIQKFGWEDEGYGKDNVLIYIMSGIDGIGNLPKENIKCQFTKSSVDLQIFDLNNKNYRLIRNNLDKEIVPEKSSIRTKKNRLTITLHKKDKNSSWTNLISKAGKTSTTPGSDNRDPTAGIMDLMKNMYEEGDDNMKRTIAQAWTESRKKGANPSFT